MEKQIKVSVVIPVYNVEKYIEQCLVSIVSQSLREIEIIVVNDMTPDSSMEIVKNYQEKDNRIIAIHNTKNLGLGGTRNVGIKHARGECIYFIDSDDWIDENTLEESYTCLKKNDAQFVEFGVRVRNADGSIKIISHKKEKILTTKEEWLFEINRNNNAHHHWVWDKLYCSKFIKENHFAFGKYYFEDIRFNLQLCRNLNKVVFMPDVFYNYRYSSSSMSNKLLPEVYINGVINRLYETISILKQESMFHTKNGQRQIQTALIHVKELQYRDAKYNAEESEFQKILEAAIVNWAGCEQSVEQILLEGLIKERENAIEFLESENIDKKMYETYETARHLTETALFERKICRDDKIILYGTGNWGKNLYKILSVRGIEVLAFVESDRNNERNTLYGLNIIDQNQVKDFPFTKIIVASSKEQEIEKVLRRLGYNVDIDYIILRIG